MGLSKKSRVVGIDIGSHSIKLVQLLQKKGRVELMNVGMISLPKGTFEDGMTENPNLVTDAIKQLVSGEKIKTKYVVTSVSGESVIIKKITLPKMNQDELAESVQLEAEQYIPFDINDVNIDFMILGSSGTELETEGIEEQMEVLLVAAKKDIIEQRESIILNAGLTPAVFDLDVFAVENSLSLSCKLEIDQVVCAINMGASITNIDIIEGSSSAFTRDIIVGGKNYTESIQKKLKIDFEEAEKMKLGVNVSEENKDQIISILRDVTDLFASEIQKSIDYYSTAANRNIDKIFLSGGSAKISGLNYMLGKKLDIKIETLDPLKNISINEQVFDPDYIADIKPIIAVATGLAYRRFDDND